MSDLVSEDHILARIASHFPNEGPDVLPTGRGDGCAVLGVSGPLCVSCGSVHGGRAFPALLFHAGRYRLERPLPST